jgi:hypothetical protein
MPVRLRAASRGTLKELLLKIAHPIGPGAPQSRQHSRSGERVCGGRTPTHHPLGGGPRLAGPHPLLDEVADEAGVARSATRATAKRSAKLSATSATVQPRCGRASPVASRGMALHTALLLL